MAQPQPSPAPSSSSGGRRRRPWWLMVTAWASLNAAAAAAAGAGAAARAGPLPGAAAKAVHPLGFLAPSAAAAVHSTAQMRRPRQHGLATCFMERGESAGAAGGSGTLDSPLFVTAPHHRGDPRMAALLGLVTERKEDFDVAVQGLEHPVQLEVVEALILNLRRHTNGGMLPAADGSLPKLHKAQRALLVEYVPAVLSIVNRLEELGHHHHDARVALYATEALTYDVSVKSLVHAAPQLARIFKNIDMMVEKHPELKGGAPFIIQGMMHLNAPPPLRSVRKAKECFEAAYRVDAESPRNNYFCGVAAFVERDYQRARAHFAAALGGLQQALSPPPAQSSQEGGSGMGRDPADEYLESQCRLGLELADARLAG